MSKVVGLQLSKKPGTPEETKNLEKNSKESKEAKKNKHTD